MYYSVLSHITGERGSGMSSNIYNYYKCTTGVTPYITGVEETGMSSSSSSQQHLTTDIYYRFSACNTGVLHNYTTGV